MVRAKFIVTEKIPADDGIGGVVKLSAVACGSAENESFFHFTPWGNINMGTVNAEAYEQFEVGKECYIDFTMANLA